MECPTRVLFFIMAATFFWTSWKLGAVGKKTPQNSDKTERKVAREDGKIYHLKINYGKRIRNKEVTKGSDMCNEKGRG